MSLANREPIHGIRANLNMAQLRSPVEAPSQGKAVHGTNSSHQRRLFAATASQSGRTQGEGTASPVSDLQQSNGQRRRGPSKPPRNGFHWPVSFFSLRWRLAFVYIILFALFVIFLSLFAYNSISGSLLMIILAALVMIVTGAIVIFYLTGIMLDPLRQMIGATRAMASGDLKRRVSVPHSDDEIGALATSFNQMANRVEELFEVQQASEQRARRFVSDASHELRTPITSLRGFTEVLMRGAKDDPAIAQRILKLMKYEADRMTRLVNDLLTLARLDEGHPLEMRNSDLVDIAIESVREAKSQAPESCKVSLDLATQERLKLQADAERLKQMLLILLDNAMKYGCRSENGSIILRLDKQDDNAIIQVIDRGQGILTEDLPHIFDRFYRGQHAPTSSGSPIGGTGLGLAIAIAIARAHRGSITVTSQPDRGATFVVTLPCQE